GSKGVVAGGNLDVDAGVAGEGHFHHGGEEAAVGAVVVGEEFFLAAELLDHMPKFLQVDGVVDIGRGGADLRNDLREDRTAEAVLAAAEIYEEQHRVSDMLVVAGLA